MILNQMIIRLTSKDCDKINTNEIYFIELSISIKSVN